MNQTDTPLVDALRRASQRAHAPFYTPGHKRGASSPLRTWWGAAVLAADLPELPELDNLFAPNGPIYEAQRLAAEAFGADDTWFLANGSTAGVIAAILATCGPGDRLILPRNVHQSVVSGLVLSGAWPVFVPPVYAPDWGLALGVAPGAIAAALERTPDAKAVLLVSPTYYGTCSDLGAIAQSCHGRNVPLLVDEAHGAHFVAHPDLPPTALAVGADVAVQSTHKTLSSLTQSAMVHRQGERVSANRLAQALQLVQSTSPSYLLLASLDAARQQLVTCGKALLAQTLKLSAVARQQLVALPSLRVLASEAIAPLTLDRTRLTVDVSGLGITGYEADEWLHERGVTAELPELRSLTFIPSLGSTKADLEQLVAAFAELVTTASGSAPPVADIALPIPALGCSPREAFFASGELVATGRAVGRICKATVCPYPPGIPALLPGEVISKDVLEQLRAIAASGGVITGCDPGLKILEVVK
ncbi:MAG: aminotransferase class I/II-fold pyridoxal phosphate-dependent enzyme [Elainellaceae cyanobacterium]